MTLIVLLSTMSFTIHKRYCSGDLVDTTLFLESESCKIVVLNDCCEISEDCCNHEQIIIDGQKELPSRVIDSLPIIKQFFGINLSNIFLENYNFLPKKSIFNREYNPPILVFNRQLIHQVFII